MSISGTLEQKASEIQQSTVDEFESIVEYYHFLFRVQFNFIGMDDEVRVKLGV